MEIVDKRIERGWLSEPIWGVEKNGPQCDFYKTVCTICFFKMFLQTFLVEK